MEAQRDIKAIFESLMFTWGELLEAKVAGDVVGITEKESLEYFEELKREYENRNGGLRIRRVNKSFQIVTIEKNAEYIAQLCTPIKKRKLSRSALEVLAIIAYKQPVTKGEMDAIRGVKCDKVVEGLLNKELIEEKGRAETIGRPILYGTTKVFLKHFGFESIKELPEIDDLEEVLKISEEYENELLNS